MLVALILLATVGTEAFQICPGRCNYQLPTAKRHTALFRSSSQSITMASAKEVDCLVIGGGVSGISAAVYADKGGAKVLLAEKAPQLGGVIETREREKVQWEDGPNTFQASAKGMLRLVADLGIEAELVASNPKLPRFVYADDNLFALPADLPKLLSPVALIRAGIGVLLPVAKSSDTDETVASFITRVLGEEVLSKVVDPFVSTVYTGDPSSMSFQSVFPAIARVAAQSDGPGGLLIGAIKSRLNKTREAPRNYGALPQVPKGSSLSFSSGLKQLPDAAARLLGEKCQVGWEATALARRSDGSFEATFRTPAGAVSVGARTVVIAMPAAAAAALLAPLAPAAAELTKITAPPVFAVTLAYPTSAFDVSNKCVDKESGRLRAFGVLIPRASSRRTLGFQCISSLFPSRAPAGKEVLLAYYGGAQNANVADMKDAEVVAQVHADAQAILLRANAALPEVLAVRKWQTGIPQYTVGHKQIVDAVRSGLPRGIVLGGNGMGGGISLGDCAEGGYKCAQEALELLK